MQNIRRNVLFAYIHSRLASTGVCVDTDMRVFKTKKEDGAMETEINRIKNIVARVCSIDDVNDKILHHESDFIASSYYSLYMGMLEEMYKPFTLLGNKVYKLKVDELVIEPLIAIALLKKISEQKNKMLPDELRKYDFTILQKKFVSSIESDEIKEIIIRMNKLGAVMFDRWRALNAKMVQRPKETKSNLKYLASALKAS